MKFGGTSIANADRIHAAVRLVLDARGERPLVVVSAISGVTNALEACIRLAVAGELKALQEALEDLRLRHLEVLGDLTINDTAPVVEAVEAEMLRLRERTLAVSLLGKCTPSARDAILASGEDLSPLLVTAALNRECVRSVAIDPRSVLRTDSEFGEASVDGALTQHSARLILGPILERELIPVTGGFVGSNEDGETTTLGRGGSDLSATWLALALDAKEVQIWSDVDGMLTADPRVVANARTLPELTFQEACELAYFGARVLHPATIGPAVKRQIPVRVKNSLRPSAPGTLIAEPPQIEPPTPGTLRAVAWKTGITLISLNSSRMLGAHGFLASTFEVFAKHKTPVDVVTTSEVSISLTVDRSDHVVAITKELTRFGRVRVTEGMAVICLVGCELLEHADLLGEILLTLKGIPLRMFCLGSSDVNLTLVVEDVYAEDVVLRLHTRFLEEAQCVAQVN